MTAYADTISRPVKTLTEAGSMVERDIQAYMVLAMAQYGLNQTDEARAALAKGAEIKKIADEFR